MLALKRGCTLNDLLVIAISELLSTLGSTCAVHVNERVRQEIKAKGEQP